MSARIMRRTPSGTPLIALEHCSVLFDDKAALDDVSFTLNEGERWILSGANGAGKTVLLKLLRGDMWPTPTSLSAGHDQRRYCLDGTVSTQPLETKHHIAYLAPERQDRYVRRDWNLTVTQIVTTGLFDEDIPLTRTSAVQRQRVTRLLRYWKLWSLRQRSILTLSYGQRRRVLLARALVSEPTVLLLDEVFNGLDAVTRQLLLNRLQRPRSIRTWIIAAHASDDIPANATHLLRLRKGRVNYAGPLLAEHHEQLRRDAAARHRRARRNLRTPPLQRSLNQSVKKRTNKAPAAPFITLTNVALFRDYRPVLRNVNWQINSGEHWAIMGRNGAGKSSLLMLLYGDLHPAYGGTITRKGFEKGTPIATWKARVGYVSPELQAIQFAAGTLEHIVASGRYSSTGLNQAITAADKRRARPWLEFFGIHALRDRKPHQVSYGQLRLALMARAMVNHPQLLLLDEPFTGLDPEFHAQARALLQKLAEQGTQLVMAVHDPHDLVPAVRQVLHIRADRSVDTAALAQHRD